MPFSAVLPMPGLDYNIWVSVFIHCQGKAEYHILSSHLKRTTDLQRRGTNSVFDLEECIYVTGINTPHFRKPADSFSRSKWQRRTTTCLYSFPSLRVIRAFFHHLGGKTNDQKMDDPLSLPYLLLGVSKSFPARQGKLIIFF